MHDVLNFYFQLANQKNVVSLLRVNDSLKQIATAENYDANHINSLAVLMMKNCLQTRFIYY
jgi:hypothetical protein